MPERAHEQASSTSEDLTIPEGREPLQIEANIIDLRFVFGQAIRWGWIAVILGAIGVSKGLLDLHHFSPISVAKMTVLPLESGNIAAPSARSGGRVNAVRALLGGPEQSTATSFDRLVYTATTISLARSLQEKFGLMQTVYASTWDSKTQSWRRPADDAFERDESINKFFNLPTWSEPTLEDLARYISGGFVVREIPDTALKEISYKHQDPKMALWLLTNVFSAAREQLRKHETLVLANRLNYIKQRLKEVTVIEHRNVLLGQLASSSRQDMLLSGDSSFSARIIEPAYISKYKTRPNLTSIIGIPAIIGIVLGAALTLLIIVIRNE